MRRCDLCGNRRVRIVVALETGRSMGSDRRVIEEDLVKVECSRCGLVYSGQLPDPQSLTEHYTSTYTLTQPDHLFVTPEGKIPRSEVFARWIKNVCGDLIRGSVCEIGAGSGHLLGQLQTLYPEASFSGIELSGGAAKQARARGLNVSAQEKLSGQYDVILSVAVIEHTPSPTEFILHQKEHLRDGGILILALPTQDVLSNDLFFFDHLYHFASAHLKQFGAKCGFEELRVESGHPLMPNYSLHLWQKKEGSTEQISFVPTRCSESADHWLSSFSALDQTLQRLPEMSGVFGVNEGYWLAHCYSKLARFPVCLGVDAVPDRPEYASLPFSIIKEEKLKNRLVTDLLLTLHPQYYQPVTKRLCELGIRAHPIY